MKKTSDSKQTKARAARSKQSVRSTNGPNGSNHAAGDLAFAEALGQTETNASAPVRTEDREPESEAARARGATALQGRIERISGSTISGWVWDPEAPDRRVRLELVEGKTSLKTTVAAEDRPELAQLGCGDGRHGFTIELQQGLLSGGQHTLILRCADTGRELPGSPIAVRSVQTARVAAGHLEVSCRGCVEQTTEIAVLGWIIDCNSTSRRCTVGLKEGSHILVEQVASDFRPDLLEAGVGDGRYGFQLLIPVSAFDFEEHLFEVIELQSGHMLTERPIPWRSPIDPAHLKSDGFHSLVAHYLRFISNVA
jgi:hypothetical protein